MLNRPNPLRASLLLAAAGTLVAVSACHAGSGARDHTTHAPAFVSAGKTQAPLNFSWRLGGKPAIGEPLNIDLTVVAASPTSGIELSIEAGRGLEARSGMGTRHIGQQRAGEATSHVVTVVPLVGGPLYVNIVAVMQTPAGAQMKTFAVPVHVEGAAAPEKAGPVIETDADGNRVVVLPAEESSTR